MSIRDLALGALADREAAEAARAEAQRAAKHNAAAEATRGFFARLGVTDIEVDGAVFVWDELGFHGNVGKDFASVFWYRSPIVQGRGNTYDSVTFTDLPTLGRALVRIDREKAGDHFHQSPAKRSGR